MRWICYITPTYELDALWAPQEKSLQGQDNFSQSQNKDDQSKIVRLFLSQNSKCELQYKICVQCVPFIKTILASEIGLLIGHVSFYLVSQPPINFSLISTFPTISLHTWFSLRSDRGWTSGQTQGCRGPYGQLNSALSPTFHLPRQASGQSPDREIYLQHYIKSWM